MSTSHTFTTTEAHHMQRALNLARQGEGHVEPNPMVGCVIVSGERVVGEGWHEAFGTPHAEVHALRQAGEQARGSTMYVTLEPCCHTGKTPPCSNAIVSAGVARVVIAHGDPNPQVAGGGIRHLQQAGVEVHTGLLHAQAAKLLAPFSMLMQQGRPWVIAKWAMTLDGKLASTSGDSQWISSDASREIVHKLRGRVDAIMVGGGTARRDDPQLTARPAGPRTATRVVVSGSANLALDSKLALSAREVPVVCIATEYAAADYCRELIELGVEVIPCGKGPLVDCHLMLQELGKRQMTNVLVEGGGRLFGSLFDADLIDELHVFIAPKLIGGHNAESPIAGRGVEHMQLARQLSDWHVEQVGPDVYLSGAIRRA